MLPGQSICAACSNLKMCNRSKHVLGSVSSKIKITGVLKSVTRPMSGQRQFWYVLDQETCPLRLSVPFAVGARILTLKFLEAVT